MTIFALQPMDLAALLCSRVCHDVISPVGAIVNGLEVLDDEKEGEMHDIAIELIKKSAAAASARLQFCRLAFGAAGSAGSSVDTGDAEAVARGIIANERTTLVWNAPRQFAPKNKVKLTLNLCQIAYSAIPRGGQVTVDMTGEGEALEVRVEAKGANARLAHGVADLIAGKPENDAVDAHSIQAFYAGLVGRDCGLKVMVSTEPERVVFHALRSTSHVTVAAAQAQAPQL